MSDSNLVACLVDNTILAEAICDACCNTAKLVLEETVHGDESWERFLLVMGKTALILRCGHWPAFDDCFMYLFMCVLQWISIYEIHFGSRGYSFVITCNFLSICMRLLRLCTCVCQKFTLLWHFTFPFICNLQLFAGRSRA